MLAAPDPPPELVKLRDPIAVSVFDQHHGRIGDVDPHLDHRGRDQHVGRPRGKGSHRSLLGRGRHLAVQQDDLELCELSGPEPFELDRRGSGLERLGLLDQRTDDVGLAARPQLLADPFVGAGPLACR